MDGREWISQAAGAPFDRPLLKCDTGPREAVEVRSVGRNWGPKSK